MCLEERPILEQNAAGIDIGSREIFVAVPPDRDPNPVRVFPTFTENLQELAAWLLQCGVTTAAMASTGVPCRLSLVSEPRSRALCGSPWILGAPQSAFSSAKRRISTQTRSAIWGRPLLGRERQRQWRRNPTR